MKQFLIGEKVKWTIGKKDRPIICRGLFLKNKSHGLSQIICYERHGILGQTRVEVKTEILQKE